MLPEKKPGAYNLVITDSSGGRHEIIFDAKMVPPGWHSVGGIDLPEGETTVTISNRTDGDYVVADAIRWEPSAAER